MPYKKTATYKTLLVKSDILARVLDELVQISTPILDRIDAIFRGFTAHGIDHSQRVIENIDSLLTDDVLNEMEPSHLFMLLAAAFLHDIGMASTEIADIDELSASLDVNGEITKDDLEEIRSNHEKRTADWIRVSKHLAILDDLKESDMRFTREIIALIARAHRNVQLPDPELEALSRDSGIHSLNFLAATLRLADEMDISKDRIAWLSNRLDIMNRMTGNQRKAFFSHKIVSDWYTSRRKEILTLHARVNELRIDDDVVLSSSEILMLLDEIVKKLRTTLHETSIMAWHGNTYVLPIYLELETEISNPTYGNSTKSDILTRADVPAIVSYITHSLYKDHNIVARELISNGIDACKPISADESYEPTITIDIGPIGVLPKSLADCLGQNPEAYMQVTDNGIGMNHAVLQNHCLVLGSSYTNSPSYIDNLQWRGIQTSEHQVIGIYGIGVFSALGLADLLLIETVPIEDSSIHLVAQLSEHLAPIFEPKRQKPPFRHGTRVTLPITKNAAQLSRIRFPRFLKHTFKRPRARILTRIWLEGKGSVPYIMEIPCANWNVGLRTREEDDRILFRQRIHSDLLYLDLTFNVSYLTTLFAWLSRLSRLKGKWWFPSLLINRREWRRYALKDYKHRLMSYEPKSLLDKYGQGSILESFRRGELLKETDQVFDEIIFLREGIRFDEILYRGPIPDDCLWPFRSLVGFLAKGTFDFDPRAVGIDLSRQTLILNEKSVESFQHAYREASLNVCMALFSRRYEAGLDKFVGDVVARLILGEFAAGPRRLYRHFRPKNYHDARTRFENAVEEIPPKYWKVFDLAFDHLSSYLKS